MRSIRLFPFLATAALVACTGGTSTTPPRGSPGSAPDGSSPGASSAASPGEAVAALPARLLFQRRLETDAGAVVAFVVLDPARAEPTQMPDTGGLGDPGGLEWSPDGTRILTSAQDGDKTVLLVIPVDGSERIRVAAEANLAWERAWSPDGRSMTFTRQTTGSPGAVPSAAPNLRPSSIVVAAADGSSARVVTDGVRPSWSPDGRRLAFFRVEDRGSEALWVRDLEAGTDRRLAGGFPQPGQGVIGDLAIWSPDGTALVAIGDGSGCALCLVDAGGGGARPIGADALAAAIPSGATDIDLVGWVDRNGVLAAVRGPTSAVIRVGIDDGTVRPVLKVDSVIDQVALAPAGGAVAFARLDPATMTPSIWFARVDGSDLHQLSRPAGRDGDERPAWQPAAAPVPWPAFTPPAPTATPSTVPGIVDLTLTGAKVATATLPASCGLRGDGVSGVEAEGDGFTVQIGLGPDGRSTHLSVAFEGFFTFSGKGFEAAPPFVVVEPGSTSAAGAFTFSDLPNAVGDGAMSTIAGRAAWRCSGPAS